MKILGVTRDAAFSPNMMDKDYAIMKSVAEELLSMDFNVNMIDEVSFYEKSAQKALPECDIVFSMMRGEKALYALKTLEMMNVSSINPYSGIKNAERKTITRIMADCNAPIPQTYYNLSEEDILKMTYPCWIKRGEGWTQNKNDVVFVDNPDQALSVFRTLKANYPNATLMATAHLNGDLVKFYGVEDTDFFFCYYPDPDASKFGIETINGIPQKVEFDKSSMKRTCDKIAKASMIYVYGGDAIIDADGSFNIIDFNDWPSFSPCRTQAAKAIVKRLLKIIS